MKKFKKILKSPLFELLFGSVANIVIAVAEDNTRIPFWVSHIPYLIGYLAIFNFTFQYWKQESKKHKDNLLFPLIMCSLFVIFGLILVWLLYFIIGILFIFLSLIGVVFISQFLF